MVRFIETVKFNPDFLKKVYDIFYDPEKGKCDFCRRSKFKAIKGWPDGLDTENLELVSIGSDYITYWAGGDWREGTTVNLQLDPNGRLIFIPSEFYPKKSSAEVKSAISDFNEQGRFLIKSSHQEDCQIAGPMMGDLPQNIGATLSLGYKTGRILPPPKKRAGSQDYNSIPHF